MTERFDIPWFPMRGDHATNPATGETMNEDGLRVPPTGPRCFTCNPSAANAARMCQVCYEASRAAEQAEDDRPGDPNIDGTDYEPAGSWAE